MTGTVTVSSADMSEWRRRRRGRKKGRERWKKRRRRKTFTLEHRPGQTRLVLSGLLGNRQGAWSNLLNSASRLLYISLFLFLCLSRSLTFGLHAAFPICRYLSHPLRRLSPSLPLLSSLFLWSPYLYQALPSCLYVCVDICFSLSFPSSLHLRPQTAYPLRLCGSATPISFTPSREYRPQAGQTFCDLPSTQNTHTCKHTHTNCITI